MSAARMNVVFVCDVRRPTRSVFVSDAHDIRDRVFSQRFARGVISCEASSFVNATRVATRVPIQKTAQIGEFWMENRAVCKSHTAICMASHQNHSRVRESAAIDVKNARPVPGRLTSSVKTT
jgi:hypothetical protein